MNLLNSMRSKIGFVWDGVSGRYGVWQDGLKKAIELLEKDYDIDYIEPTADFGKYDLLIHWEAPITILGKNAENYKRVKDSDKKKMLLFAGGRIVADWVNGYNAVVIESQIDKEEFAKQGIEAYTAFGVNTDLMRPMEVDKKYDAIHHGANAGWKRQHLVGESFKEHALIVGRDQPEDPYCFNRCRELGSTVLSEVYGDPLVELINSSDVLCQTSSLWGGGQRATLEAMACGVPVIVMTDSPKNIEYIEAGGGGVIAKPEVSSILQAYDKIMSDYKTYSDKGRKYVLNNWTHVHYAMALKRIIEKLI